MFVVHATKKVLDRCGGPSLSDGPTTTALGDWYATALFWQPQVALFVNEPTRLPVFVPLASAATLVPRFVTHLGAVLAAHGLRVRDTLAVATRAPSGQPGRVETKRARAPDHCCVAYRDQGDTSEALAVADEMRS
jgi:hypothetical protein